AGRRPPPPRYRDELHRRRHRDLPQGLPRHEEPARNPRAAPREIHGDRHRAELIPSWLIWRSLMKRTDANLPTPTRACRLPRRPAAEAGHTSTTFTLSWCCAAVTVR